MTRHARMSKTGSAHLRKALFFPAMVALRYNPVLIQLNQHLTAKGKSSSAPRCVNSSISSMAY
ncbi:MAG: IS110 family transposase [Gammaproteobacteria bacterium]|nr:IS110 family transposase [Gammaproteobacteria bacterium]